MRKRCKQQPQLKYYSRRSLQENPPVDSDDLVLDSDSALLAGFSLDVFCVQYVEGCGNHFGESRLQLNPAALSNRTQ